MSRSRYADRRALFDRREFSFGSVWVIKDAEVSIPQADKIGKRWQHDERWVVVISNNIENYHPLCPIVTIAPLSPRTDLKKRYDLELHSSHDNVAVDCLGQLQLTQPVIKKDLTDYKGIISEDKLDELQILLEDYYGLTYED
ncbi:type II toxin-antitoxin system PemK/MazF family toxin [Shouchella shacheensis]|uniref:type II toxin-antitoxin system PemK/MazF family toxin n=1 Tax=Shouchella shacheensis TaxID=1649580 RepID=UPI0007401A92|nr:type II toxin-antitoxin system PemK/MazF family toxin [Shouchella shacheensis]